MICNDLMFGNNWESGTYDFEQETEREAGYQTMRFGNHLTLSASGLPSNGALDTLLGNGIWHNKKLLKLTGAALP